MACIRRPCVSRHRLSWRDEMPEDPVVLRQTSMAFEVNSVPLSETIMPGLPRRLINAVSSRATRRPEIDVSGIAAKQSRVTSSTMSRMRNRRPQASWSWTKSTDQRAFSLDSTRIGVRNPTAPPSPPLAHRQAFFTIKPIDAVDARGLALLPQQDEQPTISETLPLVGEIAQLCPKLRVWRPA